MSKSRSQRRFERMSPRGDGTPSRRPPRRSGKVKVRWGKNPHPPSRPQRTSQSKSHSRKIKWSGKSPVNPHTSHKLSLLEHQRRVVTYMLNHRGALVYHGMGSGKTRIAVILVALLKIPAIVVLPASLRDNFRKEIRHAKVPESWFTILSSQTFLDQAIDCEGKLLIVDEAHLLRNAEGKISKKVVDSAERAKKVLLLTGTPLVNRPSDIAPLLNMIVKNKIRLTARGSSVFNRRTFTDIPTGEAFDRTFGPDGLNEVGKHLWAELFPCVFSYYSRPADSADFPSLRFVDVKLPLSSSQSQVYQAWESRTLTPTLVKMLANPKTVLDVTKLPQFRAYLDGGRRICNVVGDKMEQSAPKFSDMLEKVKKTAGKALVFSHYLDKGVDVAEQMFNANSMSYVKFTGKQTPLQKQSAVEQYNRNQVQVFLLSSAGGVGLDLHETESVHIMDPGWNEADILQAIYRAVRYKSHPNTPHATVTVYRYYCYKPYTSSTPSADMYLLQISQTKEKVNKRFLDYAIQHSMETQGVGSCTVESL